MQYTAHLEQGNLKTNLKHVIYENLKQITILILFAKNLFPKLFKHFWNASVIAPHVRSLNSKDSSDFVKLYSTI